MNNKSKYLLASLHANGISAEINQTTGITLNLIALERKTKLKDLKSFLISLLNCVVNSFKYPRIFRFQLMEYFEELPRL